MLKTAVIQMSLAEGDVEGNSEKAHGLLEEAGQAGVKLAVLPEMWWAGFSYRLFPALLQGAEDSLEKAGAIARRYGMTIIGGWPEGDGGDIYNTAFAIDPTGEVTASYRKVHLFGPMKEDRFLARGRETAVFQAEEARIGMVLCYDLRFPEIVRRIALDGAHVLVVPSQWPESRVEHFWTLLRARAIENQMFVVGANRCGRGGEVTFGGYSGIIGPLGDTRAECGSDEAVAIADIDVGDVAAARKDICYLDDRVPEVDDLA
jgi:predicted amidohydrolase